MLLRIFATIQVSISYFIWIGLVARKDSRSSWPGSMYSRVWRAGLRRVFKNTIDGGNRRTPLSLKGIDSAALIESYYAPF